MSIRTLWRIWRQLGEDERRVVLATAERLLLGRGVYGELRIASDTRDFGTEEAEELLDSLVYRRVAELLRPR